MAKPAPISVVQLTPSTAADSGDLAVTVPVGAQVVVAASTYFQYGPGNTWAASGSFCPALTVVQEPPDNSYMANWIGAAKVTATGEQTFRVVGTASIEEGPAMVLIFLNNIDNVDDFIRQMVCAPTTSAPQTLSASVTSTADDLVIAIEGKDVNGSFGTVPEGWTQIGSTVTHNNDSARVTTANTAGASSTTFTMPAELSYPTLSLISVKGSSGSDTAAPTLTSPSATATGQTTATGSVTASEACTGYAVISVSATAPTAAQVIAGQMHTGAAAAAADTSPLALGSNPAVFDFSGLTAATTYYMHVAAVDAATNTSAVVSTSSFTTSAAPQFARPDADISAGTWTPSTGATLHGTLSEAVANDADYIVASANGTAEIGLQTVLTPGPGAQKLTYRAIGTPDKAIKVGLYQGASTLVEEWTTDPVPGAVTEYVRTLTTGITDGSDLRVRVSLQNASSPPAPSVSYVGIGTGVNGTTPVSVNSPAGAIGDLLVLHVTSGATNNETPSTPSGWTSQGSYTSTGGTFGVDTGPRRVTVFTKVATQAAAEAVSVATTNGNTVRATVTRYARSLSSSTWDIAQTGGGDSTSGTGFSVAGGAISFAPGDRVLVTVSQLVDTATQSAQSLTASGITFGTRTSRATVAVTTGNDHRHVIDEYAVTDGTASVAPTWAYTASAAVMGGCHFLRIREVFQPSAAITQVVFEAPGSNTDTTAPTLSAASATPTGYTTATLGVDTNEAGGTLYAVVVLTSEPAPSAAQVVLGHDSYNSPAPAAASAAVTAAGTRTLNVTGLTSGETYTAYFVHVDGATPPNTSTVVPSAYWAQPAPDTTNPTLTGSITVTAITQTTFSSECPAASDNVAVAGYEVSLNGGSSWIDKGASRTHAATGMTPGAVVALRWRAYDAAGNRSSALSASVQMEHPGVLGSTIMLTTGVGDHGPGIMYPSMRAGDESKRYYFTIITPPTNGTLDIDPDGTFVYTGTADTFSFELFENSVSLGITTATLSFGGEVNLTANATASATSSAALQAAVKLLASAQAQAASAAQLLKTSTLSASAAAQANASANMALSKALSASAVAVASSSASMGASVVQVTADAAALASSSGALTKTIPVTAVSSATSSSSGTILKVVNLSASGSASASAGADFLGQTNLTAFGAASSTASASLSHQVPLSAAAAVVSVSAGDVSLSVTLSAAALASAIASANLQVQSSGLSASAAATALSSATLNVTVGLSAAAVVEMMAAASLSNTVRLSAAGTASAGSSAAINSQVRLAADAIARASATAQLAAGNHALQAAGAAQAASTGSLTVSIPLEAVATAAATGAGLATLTVNLTGSGAASTSSEALLSRVVSLSADAVAVAEATSQLTVFNPTATYKKFTVVRGYKNRVWSAAMRRTWTAKVNSLGTRQGN